MTMMVAGLRIGANTTHLDTPRKTLHNDNSPQHGHYIMQLKVKRLDPRAVIPKYQSDGAACFDLVATKRTDAADGIALYHTGLSFDIPQGYVLEVYSRSGHGFYRHTRLANAVGIVDSDYRGEVMVKLVRDDGYQDMPQVGERVAQAMLRRVDQVEFIEVEEMSDTARGVGGFGSTGK